MPIETFNQFAVGSQGDRVVVLAPPRRPLTAIEAMQFAAWLVVNAQCVATEPLPTFEEVKSAIENA